MNDDRKSRLVTLAIAVAFALVAVAIVIVVLSVLSAAKVAAGASESSDEMSYVNVGSNGDDSDLADYRGTWHASADAENSDGTYAHDLTISDANRSTLKFDIRWRDSGAAEDITVTLSSGIASFTGYVDDSRIEGNISVSDGSITVQITQSQTDKISPESIVFDTQVTSQSSDTASD